MTIEDMGLGQGFSAEDGAIFLIFIQRGGRGVSRALGC
jgi:hypothetical protein